MEGWTNFFINFYLTKDNPLAAQLKGIGLTMEGIENNPVMFELMCEHLGVQKSLPKKNG